MVNQGSIIIQATEEVSNTDDDVIVNDVPMDRPDTLSQPTVPPSTLLVSWISLDVVTFESNTVAVPATKDTRPRRKRDITDPELAEPRRKVLQKFAGAY